jgi:hypothetical protein
LVQPANALRAVGNPVVAQRGPISNPRAESWRVTLPCSTASVHPGRRKRRLRHQRTQHCSGWARAGASTSRSLSTSSAGVSVPAELAVKCIERIREVQHRVQRTFQGHRGWVISMEVMQRPNSYYARTDHSRLTSVNLSPKVPNQFELVGRTSNQGPGEIGFRNLLVPPARQLSRPMK